MAKTLKIKADEIFEEGIRIRSERETLEEMRYWIRHSKNAARFSETLAKRVGLDSDKAYANGLLHDIGKVTHTNGRHIIEGYRFLMERKLPDQARICLTHTFYPKEKLKAFGRTFAPADWQFLQDFVKRAEYDDYDYLAQLADFMGSAGNDYICPLEKRFTSVVIRHHNENADFELSALLGLKRYFSEKAGKDLYKIFADDIRASMFIDYTDYDYEYVQKNLGGGLILALLHNPRHKN